jgi:hypothetical protein
MAYAAAAVAIISAAVTAYSAYSASQQQERIAKYNQEVQERQAEAARAAAKVEAAQKRARGERVLAAQRAAYGASGVVPDVGSPLLVQADTAKEAEFDALMSTYAGELRARGAEGEAAFSAYQARSARRTRVANTLLSGAAAGISTYANYGGFNRPSGGGNQGTTLYEAP